LEKYCSKFTRQSSIPLYDSGENKNIEFYNENIDSISGTFNKSSGKVTGVSGTKKTAWSGIRFLLDYESAHTYVVNYTLKVTSGQLKTIGGHNRSFDTYMKITYGSNTYTITNDYYTFATPLTSGSTISVVAKYNKIVPSITDDSPQIFI
jgi:hypothetical protein